MGECSSKSPYEFSVGGKSGSFVIGTPSASTSEIAKSIVTSVSFANQTEVGEIVTMDKVEPNFFASPSSLVVDLNYVGDAFGYEGMTSKALSSIRVECDESVERVDVVVIVRDDGREAVDATVTLTPGTSDQLVELVDGTQSTTQMRAEEVTSIARKAVPSWERNLVTVEQGTSKDITIRNKLTSGDSEGSVNVPCTLIQMTVRDADGMDVPKTQVVCSQKKNYQGDRNLKSATIELEGADIDEHGDITFRFGNLQYNDLGDTIKLDARIGIRSECASGIIAVVDMSAMLSSTTEPALVVNGGWFRRATQVHGINCDWEPVVIDAIATDPNTNYSRLGRLNRPVEATVVLKGYQDGRNLGLKELHNRRKLLTGAPTEDELNINEEMTKGRKPERFLSSGSSRHLSNRTHKKLLVHGYCDLNPFPMDDFTNAVAFADPDASNPQPSNWNIDQFAKKIDKFADNNDIYGCGIVAHSQGGMAALHLYHNYWSCLDCSTSGSKMIQSVGTPYQGTVLAGALAAIGECFDLSCGYNCDLTEGGAVKWLNQVPYWARSQVHYYTTSFSDSWWSYDYCQIVTSLILDDPDDGTVEKSRGQLPGGNNGGHTTGQCHTYKMEEGSQCADRNRNYLMNALANY